MSDVIVYVNSVSGGSHGGIVGSLANAARSVGLTPVLAYGRGEPPSSMESIKIGGTIDITTHVAATRLLDAHALWSTKATKRLIKNLRDLKPALLHMHNLHGYYINIELLFEYIKSSGVKVIYTLHDCWAFTGHCSHYVSAGCAKWKTSCHDCPLTREYPASWLADASRRNFNIKKKLFDSVPDMRIVTPSIWLAEQARQSILVNHDISVIENGVDLNIFTNNLNRNVNGRKKALAVAAKFDERKGYSDLLYVASALRDTIDTTIVGLNEKQIARLPDGIVGVRTMSDINELVQLYRAADVFINTTREDTYPTVNMEAMACGTPVACYDVCGCREQLADTGFLVRHGDRDGMIDAIRAVVGSRGETLRARVATHASKCFDRRRAIGKYGELYRDLIRMTVNNI